MAVKETRVVGFGTPHCEGAVRGKIAPLRERPAQPSVAVYSDGKRELS